MGAQRSVTYYATVISRHAVIMMPSPCLYLSPSTSPQPCFSCPQAFTETPPFLPTLLSFLLPPSLLPSSLPLSSLPSSPLTLPPSYPLSLVPSYPSSSLPLLPLTLSLSLPLLPSFLLPSLPSSLTPSYPLPPCGGRRRGCSITEHRSFATCWQLGWTGRDSRIS